MLPYLETCSKRSNPKGAHTEEFISRSYVRRQLRETASQVNGIKFPVGKLL